MAHNESFHKQRNVHAVVGRKALSKAIVFKVFVKEPQGKKVFVLTTFDNLLLF